MRKIYSWAFLFTRNSQNNNQNLMLFLIDKNIEEDSINIFAIK